MDRSERPDGGWVTYHVVSCHVMSFHSLSNAPVGTVENRANIRKLESIYLSIYYIYNYTVYHIYVCVDTPFGSVWGVVFGPKGVVHLSPR